MLHVSQSQATENNSATLLNGYTAKVESPGAACWQPRRNGGQMTFKRTKIHTDKKVSKPLKKPWRLWSEQVHIQASRIQWYAQGLWVRHSCWGWTWALMQWPYMVVRGRSPWLNQHSKTKWPMKIWWWFTICKFQALFGKFNHNIALCHVWQYYCNIIFINELMNWLIEINR